MVPVIYGLKHDESGTPTLPLAEFASRFGSALLPLIQYLRSKEFLAHPTWAALMPLDVPGYDDRGSLGHIVRPDIIMTAEGPRVCELDFVPSGRGWTMAGLEGEQRGEFLDAFAEWYASMHMDRIYYATGTVTSCKPETDYFAERMRERTGFDIRSVNIDVDPMNGVGAVDRLFYRSELHSPERAIGKRTITAEPWLDSKMVFAVVHDPTMDDELARAIGEENLCFLREVMIKTYALSRLPTHAPDVLTGMVGQSKERVHNERSGHMDTVVLARRNAWVLKNTDVESDACWGCRGVVVGAQHSERAWVDALGGVSPKRKALGRAPIVQTFKTSVDFTPLWNAVVAGKVKTPDHEGFGMRMDEIAHRPATGAVNARIGAYFLVSHVEGRVIVPRQGAMTLRQDRLAHGAADARIVSYQMV